MSISHARRPLRRLLVAAAVLVVALPAANAHAGRLMITGHDPDHHCGRQNAPALIVQCHFVRVAVDYVRAGAVNPSKPVLVLDRPWTPGATPDFPKALDRAYPPGTVPRVVVDPRSAQFRTIALDPTQYTAILIAASKDDPHDTQQQDLNELDSTPDMDAINARAADFRRFFDGGGGIFVSSGGRFGMEDSERFYRFLPITLAGRAVDGPFALTDLGRRIGFTDGSGGTEDDINCCPTHMSFAPPAPESPLKIAEIDRSGEARGAAVTLVANTPRLSDLEEPPLRPRDVSKPLPPSTTRGCRANPVLAVSLRRPRKVRFQRITVFVNGKRRKSIGVARLGTGRRTKPFNVRLRRGRVSRVRIVARTTTGKRVTVKRRYRICA